MIKRLTFSFLLISALCAGQDTRNSYIHVGLQWRQGNVSNAYQVNGQLRDDRFSQLGGDFMVETYGNVYWRADFPFIGDLLLIPIENAISKPNKLFGPASGSNRLKNSDAFVNPGNADAAAFVLDEPLVFMMVSILPMKKRLQLGFQGDLRSVGIMGFTSDGKKWEEDDNLGIGLSEPELLLAGVGGNAGYIHYFNEDSPLHRLRITGLFTRYWQKTTSDQLFESFDSKSISIESMLYFKRIGYAGLTWSRTTLGEAFYESRPGTDMEISTLRLKAGFYIKK